MQCTPIDIKSGFTDDLSEGRMGMNTSRNILSACLELNGDRDLSNQISRARTDDVATQDSVSIRIHEELHKTVFFAER